VELSQIDPKIIAADCPGLVVGGDIKIGGQKRVWQCAYQQQAYVLKALMADDSTLRRVKRELEIMKVCRSQYLPQVGPVPLRQLRIAGGDQILYFLEEYIDGVPLASVAKPMPWRDVVALGMCISEALDILAQNGYVHRDVKPMNIIQRRSSIYVLLDAGFALARHDDAITSSGKVVGTSAYLSPEQITLPAKQLDIRSDLFALGVTMYQYGVGEHPFFNDHTPQGDIVRNIMECECPSPETINDEFPIPLGNVILKTLRKNRDERHSTLDEFRSELRALPH
jgi:serine/threonine protein kinase